MCGGGTDDGSTDAVGSEEDPNRFGGDDPTGNTGGQTDRGISDRSSISDTSTDDVGSEEDPSVNSSLSDAAMQSARTDQSQSQDSQSFFASDAVPNPMDFNFANSQAAQSVRQKADQGIFPNSFTPFGAAINVLSKIGPQSTINALNRGEVPTYNKKGQITGTTGQGFGMASPTGSVPGYEPFAPVVPSTNVPVDLGDDGNEQTIIRRNPTDPVEEFPTAPPISDQLATDFLQNPFFLYSGQGNLFQPYGYAQNTLVDLLRTRNMTQPQQAAANLGLFGNPGDFL